MDQFPDHLTIDLKTSPSFLRFYHSITNSHLVFLSRLYHHTPDFRPYYCISNSFENILCQSGSFSSLLYRVRDLLEDFCSSILIFPYERKFRLNFTTHFRRLKISLSSWLYILFISLLLLYLNKIPVLCQLQ